jgi:flagellar biosynthesis/type III secretory pathway protein FliH
MKLFNIKKTLTISALSIVTLLGTTFVASAQYGGYNTKQNKKVVKQQQKIYKQQQKIDNLRTKNTAKHYRVYRNGNYYQTDSRGAELLKQAVNKGYQQGFAAGQNDRKFRRGGAFNNSSMYRSGNYGYQSYVDSSQYQYYFREGFQRGYEDGYNSRYRYGSNSGGGLNILGNILQQVLNVQQY